MFSRKENAFAPHAGASKDCTSELPPYPDLQGLVEAQIQQNLKPGKGLTVRDVQFVLEHTKYEKLQTTIHQIHAEQQRVNDKPDPAFVNPLLVYHSTQNVTKLGSILKHGYLRPGRDQHPTQLWTLRMANGKAHGEGIYCSTSFCLSQWYSFCDYTKAIQLIVNVAVPGRVYCEGKPLDVGDYDSTSLNPKPLDLRNCGSKSLLIYGPDLMVNGENGHYEVQYFRSKKKDEPAIDRTYHSIWVPDRDIWVIGSSHRIVPVAVVTLELDSSGGPANAQMPTSVVERNVFLKRHKEKRASVTFCHLTADLWSLQPAIHPTLRPYWITQGNMEEANHSTDGLSLYANPYVLLVTCIRQHTNNPNNNKFDSAQQRQFVLWMKEKAPTPADFLRLDREYEGLNQRSQLEFDRIFSGAKGVDDDAVSANDRKATRFYKSIAALSRVLVNAHGGLVPTPTLTDSIHSLPGVTSKAADDFYCLSKFRSDWERHVRVYHPDAAIVVEHYYVLPGSLLCQSSFVRPLKDYMAGWSSKPRTRQFVVLDGAKEEGSTVPAARLVDATSTPDVLGQLKKHHEATASSGGNDNLMPSLSLLLDRLTRDSKNGSEQKVHLIYLMLQCVPEDMEEFDKLVEKWSVYLRVQRIMVKVLIWNQDRLGIGKGCLVTEACRIKSFLQTLPSSSPNYFWQANNPVDLENALQTWADEVDLEVIQRETETVRLSVTHPFGIAGEGFLPHHSGSAALQPTWDVDVSYNQSLLFQGQLPPYVTQGGSYVQVQQGDFKSDSDLNQLCNAMFSLLSTYQGFMFASPDRIRIYRPRVEQLAQALLAWVDKFETSNAPSVIKNMRHRLQSFLSTLETFAGVSFSGKWYTRLRAMKYGKQVARRVKKTFDLDLLKTEVPYTDRHLVKEPSDVLSFSNRRGRLISVKTFGASEIEPWLIHVVYVSRDTDGSTVEMFQASESGIKVRDYIGRRVTHVLLPDFRGDDVAKLYYGYLFTGTPYLYLPSQPAALLVNAFTCCIEDAFQESVHLLQAVAESKRKGHHELEMSSEKVVERNIGVAMDMLDNVQRVMATEVSQTLLQNLNNEENMEELLTTRNGIQSVNQILAALLLPEAAKLVVSDSKWSRLCFGLLAEAVARNCRARVRAFNKTAKQLIDMTLRLLGPSAAVDYQLDIKRSCRTTNHFMAHSFTNCSPFKAVGMLFFAKFLHESRSTPEIIRAFTDGEASMGCFLRDNLPGWGGSVTQLALYLNGLHRLDNRPERDEKVERFENPRSIVDKVLNERLDYYRIVRARAQRSGDRAAKRLEIRQAEAECFRRYHTVPRLFTPAEVEQLNKQRPANDQLRLLPHGLLLHHCCYPDCPDYLRNFETERDKQRGSRLGLFSHLRPDALVGNMAKGFHKSCYEQVVICNKSKEAVCSTMEQMYKGSPTLDHVSERAEARYEQYVEYREKLKKVMH